MTSTQATRKRAFVTGASGFVGGAIARDLAQDHDVLALSRSEASDARIRAAGATPVRGDLASVSAADLEGVDCVVHCAAWVEPWGHREDYWAANVDGTDRVLAAAREAGAARFLHMSTEAVLWRGQDLVDVDETAPYPAKTPFLYAETKAESERRVLAANASGRFETIAVRPRLVWGPGDNALLPEAIAMIERGAFSWIDGGRVRTSSTHIDNLVAGVRAALDRGQGGEAYFLLDEGTVEFRDFLTRLLSAHGVEAPDGSLPGWLARPAAALVETIWRTLRLKSTPPITRHAIGLLCCQCTLDDTKARETLGYRPQVDRATGLEALAKWNAAQSD